MQTRYYEDFTVGESYALGSQTVTEDEIIRFAEQYDPQSFHTDRDAAAETQFGALFASGWHTAALCMRQLVDGLLTETAVVGGLGVDELRWRTPVYGGDELAVEVSIHDRDGWDSETGVVTFAVTGTTGPDTTAITFRDLALVERSSDRH
jgi:acyl dehydratase